MCSASSFWRWASTPSLTSPGSTPSSCDESCSTSWMSTRSRSSDLACCTSQTAVTPSATSCSSGETSAIAHGGDIQLSGLYEPPSLCTSTDPSALTSSNRVARGRWAVSRPS